MALDGSLALGSASFAALKRDAVAQPQDEATLRKVAQQFEALLTQQVLKSARAASMGDELMGGAGLDLYKDMFDQQMAQQMSAGKGLGLADVLVQQLRGKPVTQATATDLVRPLTASEVPSRTAEPAATGDRVQDFVAKLWPHAEQAAKALGLPTEAVIGHAALETGWGAHQPGGDSHNYFGLKTGRSWKGESVNALTTEMDGGTTRQERADFRAYATPAEGVEGYVSFLKGYARYAAAIKPGNSAAQFAEGLQKAGYATDPDYATKLKAAIARAAAAKPAI